MFQQGTFINTPDMTPEQLERKREAIRRAMEGSGSARYAGEGWMNLAKGIVGGIGNHRLNKIESAKHEEATALVKEKQAKFAGSFGGSAWEPFGGSSVSTTTSGGGNVGARNEAMEAHGGPTRAAASAMEGLPPSIVQSESGGNWNALNSEGYGGRGQFGEERLADAARAGIIPAGMTGAQYSRAPAEVQLAVENWHKNDILGQLGQYVGQDIDGPGPIPTLTENSILSVAHLGGTGGARRFVESGGRYDPADSNGTNLSDYAKMHAGGGGSVTMSAKNEPMAPPAINYPGQLPGPEAAMQRQPFTPPANMDPQSYIMPAGQGGAGQPAQAAPQPQPGAQQAQPPQFDPRASAASAGPAIQQALMGAMQGGGGQGGARMSSQSAQPQQAIWQPQPMPQYTGPSVAELSQALQNPWLSLGQRQTLQTMLQTAQQASDPMREMEWQSQQMGLRQQELELQQMQNPQQEPIEINGQLVDPQTFELLGDYRTPEAPDQTAAMENYDFLIRQGVPAEQAMERAFSGGVTVNTGDGSDKFVDEAAKWAAGWFGGLAEGGSAAQQEMAQINVMDELLANGVGGAGDAWASWAQNTLGLPVAGSGVEALNAAINKMVPTQRPPGSGQMSDRDVQLFKESLPSLINSQAGNQIILDTMRGLAEFKRQQAEVATQALIGRMPREEAIAALYALPDPLAGLSERIRGAREGDASSDGAPAPAQPDGQQPPWNGPDPRGVMEMDPAMFEAFLSAYPDVSIIPDDVLDVIIERKEREAR